MNKTRLGALLCSVTASAYLIACSPGNPPVSKVKIGYQALASSWVFYVANERLAGRDRSFLEEEGLDVEAVRFDSSNAGAEALLRGDIATNSATTFTVLFNIEESSPGSLKCFGFQMHTREQFLESLIVRRGSQITSYAALKGRKLGVFPGSFNQSLTRHLLSTQGVPESSVELVPMAPGLQLQALTASQVDGLVSYEPTTTLALSQGSADLVEHSPWARHIFEPFPVATYCFSTQFVKDNRGAADRIVRAWGKAIDFVRSNPASAARTIPKYVSIPPEIAEKLNQPAQQKATEVDRRAIDRLADLVQQFGVTKRRVDTSTIYFPNE